MPPPPSVFKIPKLKSGHFWFFLTPTPYWNIVPNFLDFLFWCLSIWDIADIKFLWWWCTQSHFHVKPSLGWVVVMCAWVGVLTIFLNETFLNPPKNYLKILPKLSILDLCLVLAKIIRRYNPLPWWIFLPFRSKQCLNARYRFLWERVCMRKWGVVAFKAILAWAAALQSVAVR